MGRPSRYNHAATVIPDEPEAEAFDPAAVPPAPVHRNDKPARAVVSQDRLQDIRVECLKIASTRMNTYNAAQDTPGLLGLAATLEDWVTR